MNKEKVKTKINTVFAVAWVIVVVLVQIECLIITQDPKVENAGLALWGMMVLLYYAAMLVCYLILWRSAYHLFVAPRRVCYTVVDWLSITIVGFAMIAATFYALFNVINLDGTIVFAAAYAVIGVAILRAVCYAVYKIADVFRKKPLPAETDVQEN